VQRMGHRVFTMHQSLNPGLGDKFDEMMENPDSFPMWTSDWLNAIGAFGHTCATDSWAQASHHYLLKEFGLHLRHFLPGEFFRRSADTQDSMANSRWANGRLRNHDVMRHQRVRGVFKKQAEILRQLACRQMMDANAGRLDVKRLSNVLY